MATVMSVFIQILPLKVINSRAVKWLSTCHYQSGPLPAKFSPKNIFRKNFITSNVSSQSFRGSLWSYLSYYIHFGDRHFRAFWLGRVKNQRDCWIDSLGSLLAYPFQIKLTPVLVLPFFVVCMPPKFPCICLDSIRRIANIDIIKVPKDILSLSI